MPPNTILDQITFSKAEIINEYTTRIPFKLIDHLMVVEAELYNQKGNFIIDTGSQSLILNKVHFTIDHKYRTKKTPTTGVVDNIENPLETRLREFILHNLNLKNRNTDVIDLSHIEKSKKMHLLGIIGYDILKEYEVFIDMYLQQITLSKVDRFGNKLAKRPVYLEKIVDSVNFNLKKHSIVIQGYVNNQKVKFGLDTGAEFNQINKNCEKKVLQYFFPNRRLTLMGIGNRKIEVIAGKMYRVRLSKTVYFGPMNTVLTNLSKMNEAFGTNLDGVLGYEFFVQKRTIINYQKEKLFFVDYPLIRH